MCATRDASSFFTAERCCDAINIVLSLDSHTQNSKHRVCLLISCMKSRNTLHIRVFNPYTVSIIYNSIDLMQLMSSPLVAKCETNSKQKVGYYAAILSGKNDHSLLSHQCRKRSYIYTQNAQGLNRT